MVRRDGVGRDGRRWKGDGVNYIEMEKVREGGGEGDRIGLQVEGEGW